MKNVFCFVSLNLISAGVLSASASAVPAFSGFTSNGQLYVTFLGDCNGVAGRIKVASICEQGRMTANFAEECSVKISVTSTMRGCPDSSAIPKVLEFDLKKAKVTRKATLLKVEFHGETIDVLVDPN